MCHAWLYNNYVLTHDMFNLGVQTEKLRVIGSCLLWVVLTAMLVDISVEY